jgi:hypothetical protein
MPVYFLQYKLRRSPFAAQEHGDCGAIAYCWIGADNDESAVALALENFAAEGWLVEELQKEPRGVSRNLYEGDDDLVEYFDSAVEQGACYLFNEWPISVS